jgi:hypothetical protein
VPFLLVHLPILNEDEIHQPVWGHEAKAKRNAQKWAWVHALLDLVLTFGTRRLWWTAVLFTMANLVLSLILIHQMPVACSDKSKMCLPDVTIKNVSRHWQTSRGSGDEKNHSWLEHSIRLMPGLSSLVSMQQEHIKSSFV